MIQKAAIRATGTDTKAKKAKRLFFIGLLDISWRLAVSILLPVIFGAYLDKRFDKEPIFTIIGLALGFCLSALVIRKIVMKLQKETAEK